MKSFSCFGKLVAAVVCSFVVGQAFGAAPSLPTTSISGKTYYQIQSCADLKAFATSVNSGSTTINGIMVASFDCAGSTLTPIGNSSSYKYSGTFDGNGFSIKNVSVGTTKYGSSNPQYAGLFGYITTNAVIENVFVEGAVIYARNSGTSYAGVIAAYNEGGKITSCVVKDAQVYAAKGGSGNASYSGGIVGYSTGSTSSVTLCSVGGNSYIEATQAVGGVAGTIEKGAVVENCLCGGDVESVANQSGGNAGGIVGENGNTKTSSTAGSIERCVYTGDHVKPGATDNAYGGAIVGNGTACTSKCYYTYEGLKVGNNDEFNDDLESIKNELGNPWDTMNDEDGETLILNPRDPVTGVPQTEMYYDVTFNLNGHGTTFTQTAGKDHLIVEPEMVVVNENGVQYGVSGWYKETAGTNAWNFATEKVLVKGIILYAQWKVVYKVAFDANGGTFPAKAVKEKYFAAGETITTDGVTNPTRIGFEFLGWATSGTATSAATSFGTMSENITLYAVWKEHEDLTITYRSDVKCGSNDCTSITGGPSPSTYTKKYGEDFTLSSDAYTGTYKSKISSTTYTQVGWTTVQNGTTVEYSLGGVYKGNENKTFYPVFKSSLTSYTITYMPGDGVTGSQFMQIKYKDINVNLSSQTFTREGFVQDGWSESAEGTTKNYGLGALYVKNAKLTLYPHWVKRVTVTFMDGTNVYDTQTVDEGSKVSKPSNPTKTNYEFEGWYKENTFVNEFKFSGSTSNESLTENTTLYAKFKQTRFFVNIEVVGNAQTPPAEPIGYLPGSKVTLQIPEVLKQFESTTAFSHWEVVEEGITIDASNSFTMPGTDVHVKAYFISKPMIGYICGTMVPCAESDVMDTKDFNVDYTIKGALFTRDGFTQSGWATEENGDMEYAFGSVYSTDKDLSLYPFFTKQLTITLSEDPEITVTITLDNNDDADSVTAKVSEAYETLDPKPADPTKESSDKYDYTFKEFDCSVSGVEYTCEAKFDSTGRIFDVAVNLPEGASLVCSEGADGAENCSADGKSIKHQYDVETTPLPDADMEGWDFVGWYDNADGIEDGTNGNKVTGISKEAYGDDINVYPYFTKTIEIVVPDVTPTQTISVVIDNNDDADSVSAKIDAAWALLEDPKPTPTKESSDKYDYTFKEFDCSVSGVEYTCEAKFDSTGRIFNVAVNLPEGASLVCTEGAPGAENCSTDGKSIKYQYGEGASALPAADMEGWTFEGWFDNKDGLEDGSLEGGAGKKIEAISAESFGDTAIYPYFTKTIQVKFGDETIEVVIDYNDTQDSVTAKVNKAFEESGKDAPTKTDPDGKVTYEFDEFTCTVNAGEYTCQASFNSTNATYTITYNLLNGESSNANYTYSETEDFTLATDIEVTGWTFSAWYADAEHTGDAVTKIAKGDFGNKVFYGLYTQVISVTIGENTFSVTIDSDDDEDSINAKILAEARKQGIEDPTKTDSDGKITYEFEKYSCTAGASGYTCENVFKETYTIYTVAVNLPEGASLVCTEDATGAANCSADGKSIKHQYDVETTPLPDADMEGWAFEGWFDNKDGIADGSMEGGAGKKITSISAESIGDTAIYPYFTKTIEIVVPGVTPTQTISVVIDNNDDADSVSAKIDAAWALLEDPKPTPTKESSDKYDYTFKEFDCSVSGVEYTCEAKFDSTGRVFEVAFNLPEGATLVSPLDSYTYGNGVTLPEAQLEGWTFDRWVDGTGNTVSAIGNEEFGDKSFTPVFKKNIEVVIGDVTLEVEILYTDTDEQIQEKIAAAMAAHDPKIDTPTKEDSDTHTFTFDKFVVNEDGKYVPAFDSTGRVFDVAVNLPDNAALVCTEGAAGAENCSADGKSIKHQYDVETTPLPGAVMTDAEGKTDETWEFQGWFDNADGINDGTNGNKITKIDAETFGDVTLYPYLTKNAVVKIGENVLNVEIDNNDNLDSVNVKVAEAAANQVPPLPVPTKPDDSLYTYEFAGYSCNDAFVCEPVFDSEIRTEEIVVAYGENPDDTIHVVVKVNDTPEEIQDKIEAALASHVPAIPTPTKAEDDDSTYVFAGWTKDETTGRYVPEFEGSAKSVDIVVAYGDGANDTLVVSVRPTDTDEQIQQKIAEAFKNHVPEIPTPTKDDAEFYTYKFDKFVRNEKTGKYEARFEEIAATFNISFNLPKDGELTEAFNGYTYGRVTKLPGARIKNDASWKFMGWYTEEEGFGDKVKVIKASEHGDKTLYPLFQKEITYEVDGKQGQIVIEYNGSSKYNVFLALDAMIPEDYSKNGVTYTFEAWKIGEDGVYKPTFTAVTANPAALSSGTFGVTISGHSLEISGAAVGTSVCVYDMAGRLVLRDRVSRENYRIELSKTGSYVVRVNSQSMRVNVR